MEETTRYFEGEYEAELERWGRSRFRNLCIALLSILVAVWLIRSIGWVVLIQQSDVNPGSVFDTLEIYNICVGIALAMIVLWFMLVVRPQLETREQLISSATRLVMILSLTHVCAYLPLPYLGETELSANAMELFFWHFTACLFLPWSAWQSLKAIGPAYLFWNAQIIVYEISTNLMGESTKEQLIIGALATVILLVFVAMLFVPGMLICWLRLRRHGKRFRVDMVGREFLSMRRELEQARRIHDALFPERSQDACVRFDFEYKPQTDIGGDFVWYERSGNKVRMILIDVTGHGLTAAMTVNRIHGEILRIRGEHPEGDPALIMSLIDRYFVLTLAPHTVYATGLACELDLHSGVIKWVNGGHPPAFVLSPGRETRELETTTLMLGALGVDDFEPEQQVMTIRPGDSIIAYTDGVIESRDTRGRMLGLENLRHLVRNGGSDSNWPKRILNFVSNHARGAFEDDALIVSIDYLSEPTPEACEVAS